MPESPLGGQANEASVVPSVAAVVVVWRSLGSTIDAIESLQASTIPLAPIICVAQELPRQDVVRLAEVLPVGEVIDLEENVGFAAALNIGLGRVIARGCEWALVANNDAIIAPDCVEKCLAEARRHERTAAVSPAIAYLNRPDRLWFAGARQSELFSIVWHRGHFARAGHPPVSGTSDYIPSCASLMSLSAYLDVGPMRDDFFMYFEDVDWGYRARAKGWQLRYLGEVLALHEMGGSSDHGGSRYMSENTSYYMSRNVLRFALETPSIPLRISRVFGASVLWTIYNLTRVKPAEWSTSGAALVDGIYDAVRRRMGRRDRARAR